MKFGIVTHYYNSLNYGGNLQAYALCKAIGKIGCEAVQIPYDRSKDSIDVGVRVGSVSGLPGMLFRRVTRRVTRMMQRKKNAAISSSLALRKKSILEFNKTMIPHDEVVYNASNIADAVEKYDGFITGSDQVWHPDAVCGAYVLDFVPNDKVKFSYAASFATNCLTDRQKRWYEKKLTALSAVSVRENGAVDMTRELCSKDVEWVLDPTMLLTESEWDEICEGRLIDGDYLFCFFLGGETQNRFAAEEYAAKHGLKIVTLPYLSGSFRKCDEHFGDERLYDVSPEKFLSLIKYASCVFTDSFHATVFSLVLKKEFFAFSREKKGKMSSRIYSILELFGLGSRFCDTCDKKKYEYISNQPAVDYSAKIDAVDAMKEESFEFLKANLKVVDK